VIIVARSRSGPHREAFRIRATDPCRAAALFAADVRSDRRGSANSLIELCKMTERCALTEMVGLMDLPNSRTIGDDSRRYLWDAVKRQAASSGRSFPKYHPDAALETRTAEKSEWVKWLSNVR